MKSSATGHHPGAPAFACAAEASLDVVEASELDAVAELQRDSLDQDPGDWLIGYLANLIRRLLAFALGRSLQVEDEGLVRAIQQRLEHEDFRADILVEAIVLSDAFQNQGPASSVPTTSTLGR